jgi:3-oxoacyl-[acyl-carrier protein] reductase
MNRVEAEEQGGIALVTGASRGLGAAIARRLAADGYDIWLNFRSNSEAAGRVADEIRALGRDCELLQFDVADEGQVNERLQPQLEQRTPAVLVNNAGINKDMTLMWMPREDWQSVVDATLLGFFLVTKPVVLAMLKARRGRIVNIASTAGQSGMGGQVNYSAAKAGLIGATRSLAMEVVSRGVLVNAVAPGFIETDMTAGLPKDRILPRIPMGRMGRPEEVAGVVSFLCSPDAAYMTGQVLSVNGGLYM